MKIALVNPPWSFEGSTYFGCAEAHLPLELGYARQALEAAGAETLLIDGHLLKLSAAEVAERVAAFKPDMTVMTTAPTYLFWRCPQPELRVPRAVLDALAGRGGMTVAVGPHGSVTPRALAAKLGVDVVVRGECEEVVAKIAGGQPLSDIAGLAIRNGEEVVVTGPPQVARFVDAAPLRWEDDLLFRHSHHHHRFDTWSSADGQDEGGLGAEVEASRGCPFACTFCAKLDFRDQYRRRDVSLVMDEIDRLIGQGVDYVYFIDEIFLPRRDLLEALAVRRVRFGMQTRIDLWSPDDLALLGEAGCVSIEAGVESLSVEGRSALQKRCRLSTNELQARLILAREAVPFVQANLIASEGDDLDEIRSWRMKLQRHGVWANDPVPLYPYPSSPEYRRLFGEPDDLAWERAHAHYLSSVRAMSDIQDQRPRALSELEETCRPR